jgi:hypothetical protein
MIGNRESMEAILSTLMKALETKGFSGILSVTDSIASK